MVLNMVEKQFKLKESNMSPFLYTKCVKLINEIDKSGEDLTPQQYKKLLKALLTIIGDRLEDAIQEIKDLQGS